ncbi:MAG: carboxypeptidase regulatory-like domain-containing protein, partial [Silvibacterium sp.]|nr:carboxypeptidase regulatory-like domain-containing protein [Silvibacterium sp.]
MRLLRCAAILMFFSALRAFAQVNTGELRLRITDPAGLAVKASAQLISEANQYSNSVITNDSGYAQLARLPYGVYLLKISAPGFAPAEKRLQIASAIPVEATVKLELAALTTVVKVTETGTLIDPDQPSSIMRIGTQQIEDRVGSLPGRSVQDLVNTQPGWLYEGNAVLHPRGSEYQTQFVVDGIPLTDNRSPSFGPELEADDLDSMSIYTAGFPAEYGRRMGGVVELNTTTETNPGTHGKLVLAGGSFDTANGYGQIQQKWGANLLSATAAGSMSGHYLNPVVPENFTNNGTTGDFSARYERDFTPADRLWMSVRHELSRFQIPNELVQQEAGQRQYGDNFETMGIAGYQHIFSPDVLGNFSGMVRNNSNNLYSNQSSTPIIAFQHNDFTEEYFKGSVSIHHDNQEWKAGVDSDNIFLNENFTYRITDPAYFDPGTPLTGSFIESRPELDQSAFVEDLIRLDNW